MAAHKSGLENRLRPVREPGSVAALRVLIPPPAQGCPGHANRPSVRPVVFFGLRQKTGVGLDSGSSCGRGGSYFFHFATLRKKNTGLSAPLKSKARASPGHPWPVLSRSLRRRHLIINLLSDAALDTPRPRPPPGGSPPGSALVGSRSGAVFTFRQTRFLPPPPQTVHEVFPHTAYRPPSPSGFREVPPQYPLR